MRQGLFALAIIGWGVSLAYGQGAEAPVPIPQSPPSLTDSAPAATGLDHAAPVTQGGFDKNRFGARPEDTAYGAFQRGLYKTAFNLALPEAEAGDVPAMLLLAEIYARGLGQKPEPDNAAQWYAKAAEAGDPEAQLQTALYQLQRLEKGKDTAAIRDLLTQSAQAGNALAAFNLAQLMLSEMPGPSGLVKSAPFFEQAAKAGLADAQYAMAQLMTNGYGTELPNLELARAWLKLAAEQGLDTAQLDYATALVDGIGGPRNYEAGFLWMLRAARTGNVAAQLRLARLYRNGIGTEGNSLLAAAWYIKARRAGLNDAQMDVFLEGLDDKTRAEALGQANAL